MFSLLAMALAARQLVPAALSRVAGQTGPYRSIPDISADADPATAMAVGVLSSASGKKARYVLVSGGGTSEATPLIAGIVAAAQQGSKTPFGFLNPALYKLAGTKAPHDVLPFTASTPSAYRAAWCPEASCGVGALVVFDDQSTSKAAGFTGQVTLK
jgi:hypothetical protein